jgi:hypothetical protein
LAGVIPKSAGIWRSQVLAFRNWTLLLVLASGLAPGSAAMAQVLEPDSLKLSEDRLQPGLYPAAPLADGAEEPAHLPFHFDWSLGLKGSYTNSSTQGSSFLSTLNPAFSAVHDGRRVDLALDGNAEIARSWNDDGALGLTALRLGVSANTALDSTTRLTGNAALALSQPLPSTPDLSPSILTPPQALTGSAGLGIERSFGKVNLVLKGNLERTIYGETLRSDTGWTDNSSQNVWQADTSLRAGLQITPILEVFTEASLGRDVFDRTAASGISGDATSTALRGGIAGSWNGVWSASASLGIGHHDFDDDSLGDITTRLYDASLTYSPDETISLTASLSTSVEPTGPDGAGTARVAHVIAADLAYDVNAWLRLRASADWGLSVLEGTTETERRSGVGAGADYALNAHTALSADYGYSRRDNSVNGESDSHSVSLGVTIKR